jgi:ArsR family transcriptional regulator, arsenate/arsenite/antimonite-responsive transcriptional repressor
MVMSLQGARRAYDEPWSSAVGMDQAAAVFAALGHRIRLELWSLLVPYGSRGLSAGHIAAQIGIVPSSLSFHLQQMTRAGILTQRRSRRQIIYAVDSGVVNGVCSFIAKHATGQVIRLSTQSFGPADDRVS